MQQVMEGVMDVVALGAPIARSLVMNNTWTPH
jgi:hypothetical protein